MYTTIDRGFILFSIYLLTYIRIRVHSLNTVSSKHVLDT